MYQLNQQYRGGDVESLNVLFASGCGVLMRPCASVLLRVEPRSLTILPYLTTPAYILTPFPGWFFMPQQTGKHYSPAPANVFEKIVRALQKSGILAVTSLLCVRH